MSREPIVALRDHVRSRVLGQERLVDRLLVALLADGHLLVEGAPGLAKTRVIRSLAEGIEGDFQRIQFTPDLLPGDLTGNDIYRPQDGSFRFAPGPLFHNLILADEVNRAPAKVQSALLEAMGEGQITVGGVTHPLPELFLVMATQNPIEQEGTYPLPEAQMDRFLLQVTVDYPEITTERSILHLARQEALAGRRGMVPPARRIKAAEIFAARREVLGLYMAEPVEEYIVQLVMATRTPQRFGPPLERWIRYGASPRATIALDRSARAHAWLAGREFVTPEDVQGMAHDVLRHRLLLTYEAEAEGVDAQKLITELLHRVPAP
ncbi:MAG: MoxR family ATPase [Magnetococcus sp. WYHC-3]